MTNTSPSENLRDWATRQHARKPKTEAIAVECLECGRKFKTRSTLPSCARCGGTDIDVRVPA